MQGRVARRVGPLLTVSEAAKGDICRDFRIKPSLVHIVPLGVDTRLFRPAEEPRVTGRIVTVTSADHPLKGLTTLLRATAKLVTERDDVHLMVIGSPSATTRQQVAQLGLGGVVTFTSGLPDAEYARLIGTAQVAVIPSMYEGFSLPAVEHMASGTPLVASRAGALPEVTGDAAALVTAGDPEELAATLRVLLDHEAERSRLAALGLARVGERFAWPAVAAATVAVYRKAINGELGC
jgi:glycosyltransferase involved in cell wall biosynthesis